ncbi:MotA/TolQ/ExbB proton channel family protein [Saccharicrinis sp. FJH54]|uniref:MotA/TolQ/ExbB proton channel family protein n=1 Tax=Saccharicrinis sp. FJH54 TaxID=3344665 RepID=UPI0035D42AA9
MALFEKLQDAGLFISYPIIIILIIEIVLFVRALPQQNKYDRTIKLLISLGWFAIAWGYLGRTLGLIEAFDNVAASGEFAPSMLSGGLKKALLGPLMGIITFIIARAGILVLHFINKKSQNIKTVD